MVCLPEALLGGRVSETAAVTTPRPKEGRDPILIMRSVVPNWVIRSKQAAR